MCELLALHKVKSQQAPIKGPDYGALNITVAQRHGVCHACAHHECDGGVDGLLSNL